MSTFTGYAGVERKKHVMEDCVGGVTQLTIHLMLRTQHIVCMEEGGLCLSIVYCIY